MDSKSIGMLLWILGALVVNDLIVLYTGHLVYKKLLGIIEFMCDIKVMHCERCHRPTLVYGGTDALKTCSYCTPQYCDDCGTSHGIVDDGYVGYKNKLKSKKSV
ncbi:MAG: hypothetical protein WA061_02175 [Microgenomates group bacterium]